MAIMVKRKVLVPTRKLSSTLEKIFTAGSLGSELTSIFFCNTSAESKDFDLYIVEAGSSPTDSNLLIKYLNLDPCQVMNVMCAIVLNPNAEIWAKASFTNSISIYVSGIEDEVI